MTVPPATEGPAAAAPVVAYRPAPDVPVPSPSAAPALMRAALASDPGVPLEVLGDDAAQVARRAVMYANRAARRKVLRSYQHEGRMFVVRLADEDGQR